MVEVIKNILDKEKIATLKNACEGSQVQWNLGDCITHNGEVLPNNNISLLTHAVCKNQQIYSPSLFDFLKDCLLPKLDIKAVLRIKLNFYPYTETLYEHPLHYDYDFKHKACLLFLNTCDGYTYFENGEKYQSEENTAILFDASKLHGSTNTSNQRGRFTLIVNYL